MPITPPDLTPPPEAPNRDYPNTFRALGDVFLAWFATLYADLVAVLANVFSNATDAYNSALSAIASAAASAASASSAASSANAAASSAGAIPWPSGVVVAQGARVVSLINGQVYRRTSVAGSGVTDPSNDYANYARAYAEPELVTAESFFF